VGLRAESAINWEILWELKGGGGGANGKKFYFCAPLKDKA
jgi:hypothetical protein